MWHCVVGWGVSNISRNCGPFIFKVMESTSWNPWPLKTRDHNPSKCQEPLTRHSLTSVKVWIIINWILNYLKKLTFSGRLQNSISMLNSGRKTCQQFSKCSDIYMPNYNYNNNNILSMFRFFKVDFNWKKENNANFQVRPLQQWQAYTTHWI